MDFFKKINLNKINWVRSACLLTPNYRFYFMHGSRQSAAASTDFFLRRDYSRFGFTSPDTADIFKASLFHVNRWILH